MKFDLLITNYLTQEIKMKHLSRSITILVIFCLFIIFSAPLMAGDKVNINTANVEELCTLEKIGDKYAQRIIDYRKENKFEAPEEIMEVKGIGTKTYEINKDRIIVEDEKS
jgi:competence protein ComEA